METHCLADSQFGWFAFPPLIRHLFFTSFCFPPFKNELWRQSHPIAIDLYAVIIMPAQKKNK